MEYNDENENDNKHEKHIIDDDDNDDDDDHDHDHDDDDAHDDHDDNNDDFRRKISIILISQSKAGFARQLFQQPKSGTLTVDREELETYLKKTYSDPTREIPLEETTGLVWPDDPGIKFDSKHPSLQEVIAVVNKARAKSAPGPNGVPYLLYKRCPNVLKKLPKIL
ncbi:reverse transcriptase [Plakobranchus ocellatus]|uniref:Reverse transcriptase n=1 Tax=Plakobranchus ocellatus TaxID=259542 RepID=A0AAV3ZD97_9GAST|nr:reverse transcriptase [Plakobranchus ocellatus]